MTRLIENDINEISENLIGYDNELKRRFGFTLEEIARKAAKVSKKRYRMKTAVIPVTSGLGIIGGFSQTVCDILNYCNADAFVTKKTDVAGLQEAYQSDAKLIFMADDEVCAAFSLQGKIASDNGYATGISFAAALEQMMDQTLGEEILILGAGPVGKAAAGYFSDCGATPIICDLQEEKAILAARTVKNAKVEKDIHAIKRYRYILDATTSGGFIQKEDVTKETRISAPGMPLGVANEILDQIPIFHNPLELGIMTMYYDCIHQLEENQF